MQGFGERLKAARKAKGLTQEEIAAKVHIHRTTYTKYECDKTEPPMEMLISWPISWRSLSTHSLPLNRVVRAEPEAHLQGAIDAIHRHLVEPPHPLTQTLLI